MDPCGPPQPLRPATHAELAPHVRLREGIPVLQQQQRPWTLSQRRNSPRVHHSHERDTAATWYGKEALPGLCVVRQTRAIEMLTVRPLVGVWALVLQEGVPHARQGVHEDR